MKKLEIRMANDMDTRPFWLLRRGDQAAVAGVLGMGLFLAFVCWEVRGGGEGWLVEANQAPQHHYSFLVDVNRADWPELAQLPGIGEITARKIIASRKTDGPFAGPDDLERIRGIGEKKVERIRAYLVMGGE